VEVEPVYQGDDIYQVIATNKGRTPAEMVDGYCGHNVYPMEDSVPNEERMAPFLAPLQSLTLPGEHFEVEKIRIRMHPIDNSVLPPKQLYCFGVIRYWDMFTDRTQEGAKPLVTQWCFQWQGPPKCWVRSPNGYSKNT
jgi:hypothetical protein